MQTDLATRKTVEELVREWNQGLHKLKQGLEILKEAEDHFKCFDNSGYNVKLFRHDDHSMDFDTKRTRLKGAAWRYLVDRIELKKMASIKRSKEIDKQLHENSKDLPDITMDCIFGWLETMSGQAAQFMEEAAVEVYKSLRPWQKTHKTNSQFRIGKKVILTYRLQNSFYKDKFSVNYSYQDELKAIDNIFHLLDGKKLSAYRNGDLCTAIEGTPGGIGETEFFKFKCFRNQNLHLEFKRMDLVQKINQLSGNALPDPERD